MAGLDSLSDNFRFSPLPQPLLTPPSKPLATKGGNKKKIKENTNPNLPAPGVCKSGISKPLVDEIRGPYSVIKYPLDGFEKICPPDGENRMVIYTTTLRGVRKTYRACNAVRAAIQGLGVSACERDISMDKGFREELRELMKGKESNQLVPPRVFVKGRYVGGAEEVMRIMEDGCLGEFLQGLPKLRAGFVCEGCGVLGFCPILAVMGAVRWL